MKQREVTDSKGTQWRCMQAMGGLSAEAKAEATERLESEDGNVPVVCTPTGGAQSVRVELPRDWEEKVEDEALVRAIEQAQK